MDNKFSSDNKSEKNTVIATIGNVLAILGATAFIASDFIRSFQLPDIIIVKFVVIFLIYLMAPLGVSLIFYARRHKLNNVVQEIKREGFTKTMENFVRRHENVGGKVIADPFAEKIDWFPLKPVAVQLTMRLDVKDSKIFHISYSRLAFYLVLLITPVLMVFISSPYWALSLIDHSLPADLVFVIQVIAPYFLVLGFVPIALVMMPFYGTYAETTIDGHKQTLEQTRPWFSLRRPTLHTTSLNRIHAIQLLGYKRSSDPNKSTDVRYEMNLVLKDAKRINVMSGYSPEELQRNGKILARSLGLPLWDKTHIIHNPYLIMLQSLDDKHK